MFYSNLKEILEDKQISINKFSNEIGISRPTLTKIINNDVVPEETKLSSLYRICKGLKVPFNTVFFEKQKINKISVHKINNLDKKTSNEYSRIYIIYVFISSSDKPLILIGYTESKENHESITFADGSSQTFLDNLYITFATSEDFLNLKKLHVLSNVITTSKKFDGIPKNLDFWESLNSENTFMDNIDGFFKTYLLQSFRENNILSNFTVFLKDYAAYNQPMGDDTKFNKNADENFYNADHYSIYNSVSPNVAIFKAMVNVSEDLNKYKLHRSEQFVNKLYKDKRK